MAEPDVLVWGEMHSVDFDEKTVTVRVDGDMPTVRRGRYVVADAKRFDSILRQSQLWLKQQEATNG